MFSFNQKQVNREKIAENQRITITNLQNPNKFKELTSESQVESNATQAESKVRDVDSHFSPENEEN